MYTNINSSRGIQDISSWIEEYKDEISENLPTELFIKILQNIMSQNVFQLDDTYWLQTFGTSMGMRFACAYMPPSIRHT
jgi:hypothetical protein